MDERLREKVETLNGDRRKDAIRKAAVRIEDLAPLLELRPTLRAAKAAGSEPTAAEYNALLADLEDIHRRLATVVSVLQGRILA